MNRARWFVLVFLSAIAVTPTSFAGKVVGNGGHVVQCGSAPTQVLDYYLALRSGEPLARLSGWTEEQVVGFFVLRLSHTDLGFKFLIALDTLGPISSWTPVDRLEFIDDMGAAAKRIGTDCEIFQAAVRQRDRIAVSVEELAMLTPAQRGILRAHEALYYVLDPNGTSAPTSASVHKLIVAILSMNASGEDLLRIIGALFPGAHTVQI